MTDHPIALDQMLAAWNEPDANAVRGHLDQALHPHIRFVDPSIDLTGIDAFEQNVHEVKARLPGAVYSRASAIDSQHGFHRYHWAIHHGGKLALAGFDVTEIDTDGRIRTVIGFFGPLATHS
ncbi:MAG: hypothetical protein AAGA84_08905 [Pseudomonadota bacterium]